MALSLAVRRPGGRRTGRERRGRPVRTAGAPACRGNEGGLCACPGFARCYALWGPQATVNRAIAAGVTGAPAATPKGWGAKELESAYKLPVSRHPHQTVAVTIAYHTPHLAHYLAVYRKE